MTTLKVKELTKTFTQENSTTTILNSVSFTIKQGEFVAITGASGSGKSTLLSIIAGLDNPSSGEVYIGEHLISSMNEDELSKIRLSTIGYVFQSFFLVPSLSALENVLLPQEIKGGNVSEKKAITALKKVGMEHRKDALPKELSGGEKQRVAIARALINSPDILFADEPTGSLDEENTKAIMSLLTQLQKKEEITLIIVTHEQEVSSQANRVLHLEHGVLTQD